MKNLFKAVVMILFLALPAMGQTNVAPPPTFHFVAGGSAIGFNAGNGSQAGSLSYTGLQLTSDVSVTYEHFSIPSVSATGNMAVVGYTRPLSALLGSKLAKKFLFSTDDINVTFSGGAGRWTTSKSEIAGTVGASLSYPIAGTSAAIQILGYQYVFHTPAGNGLVSRNSQVQSGIIVFF